MLKEIILDVFKETSTDGNLKWSSTRLTNAIWLFCGLLPATWYSIYKEIDISNGVIAITGLLFFGIQTNKLANGWVANKTSTEVK